MKPQKMFPSDVRGWLCDLFMAGFVILLIVMIVRMLSVADIF